MAVTVKVGDIFTEVKTGSTAKGAWGQAIARAEKGYDRITIWFTNPLEVPEGTYAVQVEEITEVGTMNKQVNGKWYTQYNARAKVKAVEGGATPVELGDEGLPF